MQLSQSSWIIRIAYLFTQQANMPAQTDRCTLWQRFCLFFIPWIFVNILVWIVGGVILGLLGNVLWRIIAFLFAGKKLVYDGWDGKASSIACFPTLTKLAVLYYRHENIGWLNWIETKDGFRCPIAMLFATLVFAGFLFLIAVSIPDAARSLFDITQTAGSAVYHTISWWGTALLVIAATFLTIFAARRAYKAFAATPSGAVVVAHFKEWKQEHCQLIELV